MDKLLIFRSGFPGNLVAAILEGINISVFFIIKLLTYASNRRKIIKLKIKYFFNYHVICENN